jgi:hypothetical protein
VKGNIAAHRAVMAALPAIEEEHEEERRKRRRARRDAEAAGHSLLNLAEREESEQQLEPWCGRLSQTGSDSNIRCQIPCSQGKQA